jgi:phospholipid/cholesterol/gamma-HCH transport system substrate-binding protein
MGAVLLLVGAAGLFVTWQSSQIKKAEGYKVVLRFNKVGGLQEGNAVRVGGVQVGVLTTQKLDPEALDAVIELTIQPDIKLPKDTMAEVASDGLLGGKFIQLTPGKSKEMIPPGGRVDNTKGVSSLEQMVGQAVFGSASQ